MGQHQGIQSTGVPVTGGEMGARWFWILRILALVAGVWVGLAGGTRALGWCGWAVGAVALASFFRLPRPSATSKWTPPRTITIGPYEAPISPMREDPVTSTYRAVALSGPLVGQTVSVSLARTYSKDPAAEAAEKVRREIAVQQTLDHSGLVKLLDSGEHHGRPYKVEPLLEAPTLADTFKKGEFLSLERARRLARQIGGALCYLHERELVHGLLQPGSVRLGEHQDYLADFPGVGRVFLLKVGTVDRTVKRNISFYWAPEVLDGSIGPASDQFGLASLLFRCLTGADIFEDVSLELSKGPKVEARPRKLRDLCPDLPEALETALARMLDFEPNERFPSMQAALEALEEGFRAARPSGSEDRAHQEG